MRRIHVVLVMALVAALGADVAMAQKDNVPLPLPPTGPGLPEGAICDTENITGVTSHHLLGDPANTVINKDLSATCVDVSDVGWAGVVYTSISPSWGVEARIQFSASDGSDASTVGFTGATSPGTFGPFTGNLGSSVAVLGDLVLRMEFFETFDDAAVDPDAVYNAGDINIAGEIIPVELQEFSID